MVGAGSTASRVFLENLHTALLADFKANNIQTDFLYLGKTERKTNINLSKIENLKHHFFLLFTPTDTSNFTQLKYNDNILVGSLSSLGAMAAKNIYNSKSHNYYNEVFFVEVFTSENLQEPLLIMKLWLEFDLAKQKKYTYISQLILKELKQHNFINF